MRHGTKKAEDIQEPKDNDDDNDRVQDRLNRALHGNVAIYQPEQNANDDQNQNYLN
jgi:hypothetical protein